MSKEIQDVSKQMKGNFKYMMSWMGEQYRRLERKISDLEEDMDEKFEVTEKRMHLKFEQLSDRFDIRYESDIGTLKNRVTALEEHAGLHA